MTKYFRFLHQLTNRNFDSCDLVVNSSAKVSGFIPTFCPQPVEEYRLRRVRALQLLGSDASPRVAMGRSAILMEILDHHWIILWFFHDIPGFRGLAMVLTGKSLYSPGDLPAEDCPSEFHFGHLWEWGISNNIVLSPNLVPSRQGCHPT